MSRASARIQWSGRSSVARWSLPVIAGLLIGCGPDDASVSSVTDVRSAALSIVGPNNISAGVIPNSIAQSETAAAAIGNVVAVAYDAFADPIPGERCFGDSEVGLSYYAAGWKGMNLYPNYAAAMFTGDPSIAAWDPGGSNYTFWVSTKAISGNLWDSLPKTADSCISTTTLQYTAPDAICVVAISIPKSSGGGVATITSGSCNVSTPGLTGATALTVSNGIPYVAGFVTGSSYKAVFYRGDYGGSQLAQPPAPPLPWGIAANPIFAQNTPLDMFFADSMGTMWETLYNVSADTWSAPRSVNPPSWGNLSYGGAQTLPFGAKAGAGEYTAAYLPGSAGPGNVYLFYRSNIQQIVGWARSTSTPGWTQVFTSAAGRRAFHPATAIATIPHEHNPYTGYHLGLTFWDDGGSNGAMNLKYTDNVGVTAPITLTSEVPCPHVYLGSSFWGYYDGMVTFQNNTADPYFGRFFTTDKTWPACMADTADWTTNTPQHVAAIEVEALGTP